MKEVFVIELEALPSDVPVEVRLKRLIKCMGRAYGFKVTRCAARYSNPEPEQPALSPLPKREPRPSLSEAFEKNFENQNKKEKGTK